MPKKRLSELSLRGRRCCIQGYVVSLVHCRAALDAWTFRYPRRAMIRSLFVAAGLTFALMPPPRGAMAAEAIALSAAARVTLIRSPDGVTFEAYEWGRPDGRPLVFIHGIYQSALSWAKQLAGRPLAYTDVLRSIRVPTLIIQGDIDAVSLASSHHHDHAFPYRIGSARDR
jgi:hypothetical protein